MTASAVIANSPRQMEAGNRADKQNFDPVDFADRLNVIAGKEPFGLMQGLEVASVETVT